MMDSDPNDQFNLSRFLDAQSGKYQTVVKELKNGRKTSHWMWYIFPQIEGLGSSQTSKYYAIKSGKEARAYLQHSVLGPRLIQCVNLTLELNESNPEKIFGSTDRLKFFSSMTLFAISQSNTYHFQKALDKYYNKAVDENTLRLLRKSEP